MSSRFSTEWFEKKVKSSAKISSVAAEEKLVYWIALKTRPSGMGRQGMTKDRFLTLFFHTLSEELTLRVVSLHRKSWEAEVHIQLSLKSLTFLDFGSAGATNDLILGVGGNVPDVGDQTLTVSNQIDRDDCAWIIASLCRQNFGVTLADTNEGMGMDILDYSLTARNEIFRRFSALRPLLSTTMGDDAASSAGKGQNQGRGGSSGESETGADMTDDEMEAERLLDALQLQQGAATASPDELQAILQRELLVINTDIIDVLMQWEEADLAAGGGARGTSRPKHSSQEGLDIGEALEAIASTEQQLKSVEDWLSTQINCLSATRSMLAQIEEESCELERGYKNLSAVQNTLRSAVQGLAFDPEDATKLASLCRSIFTAIRGRDPLSALSSSLAGVNLKVADLRARLDAKSDDKHTCNEAAAVGGLGLGSGVDFLMSPSLSHQRKKLAGVLGSAMEVLSGLAPSVFTDIIRHTSAPKVPATAALETAVAAGVLTFCGKEPNAPPTRNISSAEAFVGGSREVNTALRIQADMHCYMTLFAPLMKHLQELSATSVVDAFRISYLDAMKQHFYAPLIKLVRNEVLAMTDGGVQATSLAGGLATAAQGAVRRRVSLKPLTSLASGSSDASAAAAAAAAATSGDGAGGSTSGSAIKGGSRWGKGARVSFQLKPWTALELLLQLLAPLVAAEEAALTMFYHTASPVPADVSSLFASVNKAVDRVAATAGGGGDGREGSIPILVGMLLVLKRFESHPVNSTFFTVLCTRVKAELETRLSTRMAAAGTSLRTMTHKVDTKRAGVLAPVLSFPPQLDAVLHMSMRGTHYSDDTCSTLAASLLAWIEEVAKTNVKYADVIRMSNLSFLEECFLARVKQSEALRIHLKQTAAQRKQAATRYVDWMIEYEFERFAGLSRRIASLGKAVRDDELALYVRRHEIVQVAGELDMGSVETGVREMGKRLNKHFGSADLDKLGVQLSVWAQIRDTFCERLAGLVSCAELSYRLSLKCDAAVVRELFLSLDREMDA